MSIEVLSGICNSEIISGLNIPFEFDEFQKHAIVAINNGNNVLVTAHTGAGKTIIAKHAILHHIRKGKRVIYTSPIKTLSNEKYREFSDEFGAELTIGILTGDHKINPDGMCLIMTTEILRNALYFNNTEILDNTACVILDEVHYINDVDRGHVWEEVLMMLDRNIQIVMLSATVSNAEWFANWLLSIKGKTISIVSTNFRPVPLRHYIISDDNLLMIMDENNVFNMKTMDMTLSKYSVEFRINNLVNFLRKHDLLQTIIFSFSRNKCEKYAKMIKGTLLTQDESVEVDGILKRYLRTYEDVYKECSQYNMMIKLIKNGVAFHHSGLISILKEIIEIIFKRGLIKVLFATETFAVGVNMPTRTVVFTEIEKHDRTGKRYLTTSEYRQMSGRAGRRGIDKIGYVIIYPLYESLRYDELKSVMVGNTSPLTSHMLFDYDFIIKYLHNIGKNPVDCLRHTLYENEKVEQINMDNLKIKQLQDEIDKEKLHFSNIDIVELESAYLVLVKKEKVKKRTIGKMKTFAESTEYKRYCNYKQKIEEIYVLIDKRNNFDRYAISHMNRLMMLLVNNRFLNEDRELTLKGIVSSNINEANLIILTEILFNKWMDTLDENGIIGLLSIFVESDDIELDLDETYLDENLIDILKKVKGLVISWIEQEDRVNIHSEWNITYNFIQIAYWWSFGTKFEEIKEYYDIYEGNFVRNMIKIYNIIRELIVICDITHDVELLQKLGRMKELIIRDIVNLDSLYLS